MHRAVILLIIPLLTGCYTYRPVVETRPPAGERLRFTFTDSGTANLAAQLGPSTEALSGRLLQDSGEGYVVSVTSTRQRGGIERGWNGEQVNIPRPLIAQLEQRHFSRKRTVLMSIATVVVGFAVRDAFWGPGGGWFRGEGPGGGGGPR